jgi:hypothetical protein
MSNTEDAVDSMLVGTAAEHNKHLRLQIFDARHKRDEYIREHFAVVAPFLLSKVSESLDIWCADR